MASLAPIEDMFPALRKPRVDAIPSLGQALADLDDAIDRADQARQELLDSLPMLMTPFGPPVLDRLLTDAEHDQQYDHDNH